MLPKPYLQLAKLLDDAERMDWEVVRKVIEKDRGASVEEVRLASHLLPVLA